MKTLLSSQRTEPQQTSVRWVVTIWTALWEQRVSKPLADPRVEVGTSVYIVSPVNMDATSQLIIV